VGIATDLLFPPESVRRLADEMQEAGVDARYWEMDTHLGHDAFLEEQEKLAEPIRALLAACEKRGERS